MPAPTPARPSEPTAVPRPVLDRPPAHGRPRERPRRSPAYTTTLTVTAQRGRPRVFISGRYLEPAQLGVGTPIRVSVTPQQLVIETDPASRKRVNPRKAGVPVIDLNEEAIATCVRPGDRVHVQVTAGRIVVTLAPLAERMAARPQDSSMASCFSGVGGFDVAGERAGFRSVLGVERDATYAESFQRNHPTATVLNLQIEEVVLSAVTTPPRVTLPTVELLLVGLPCEAFTNVRRTNSRQQKRACGAHAGDHALVDMGHWTLALATLMNPRTVILETAREYQRSESCAALTNALRRLGYVVTVGTVHSDDYGQLMRRSRTALIAQTPAADGTVPSPWPAKWRNRQPVAALLDVEVPDSAWIHRADAPNFWERSDRARAAGRGFRWQHVYPEQTRLGTMTANYWNGRLRVDQPNLVHPDHGPDVVRPFSIAEGLRLFGLPGDFDLPAGKVASGAAIGQSVAVDAWEQVIRAATGRPPRPDDDR